MRELGCADDEIREELALYMEGGDSDEAGS
jgi:hypothetical protein